MPQAVLPPSPPGTDPRICDLIEAAQRQHDKIGTCAACGGPEVFSKSKPTSRYLRCRRHRALDAIAPQAKRHRCLACRKIFRSVVNWQTCDKCRAKLRVTVESHALGLRTVVTPQ